MKNKKGILDEPFIDKNNIISKSEKNISKVSVIFSTLIIIQSLVFLFYWELATAYLGWRPYDSFLHSFRIIDTNFPITGNLELKEIVRGNYEYIRISYKYLYRFLIFISTILLFFLFVFPKNKTKISIQLYGIATLCLAMFIVWGAFGNWMYTWTF